MEITNNNKNLFSFKKKLFKFTIFFVAILIFFGALNIKKTFAYFNDSTIISENSFNAKTLDLVTSSNDLGVVHLDAIQNYSLINQGDLAFEYGMSVELYEDSDVSFCNELTISVLKDTDILYSGNLLELNFTKLIGETQDNLTFIITDSSTNGAGKVCNFNFVSKAWQDALDYSKGFTDIAYSKIVVYSNNVDFSSSSGIVLNEFLPNPDGYEYGFDFGKDNSHMPRGEWVELYNNGDTDKDLTGWYLADKTPGNGNETPINTDHILVSSPIIPAHGWLVVYMNKQTYNNKGDTVRLFDSNNVLIDSYSYGNESGYCNMEPTPNGENDTNPSGNCNGAPGNKSYARIPDGVGEWVDPIPTPGELNGLGDETIQEEVTESIIKEEIIPEEIIESMSEIKLATEIVDAEIIDVVVLEETVITENIELITEQETIEENIEKVVAEEITSTNEKVGEKLFEEKM